MNDYIAIHSSMLDQGDRVEFTYHGKIRKGEVLEAHTDYCKVELDTGEVKNFRYNKIDKGLIKLYDYLDV